MLFQVRRRSFFNPLVTTRSAQPLNYKAGINFFSAAELLDTYGHRFEPSNIQPDYIPNIYSTQARFPLINNY